MMVARGRAACHPYEHAERVNNEEIGAIGFRAGPYPEPPAAGMLRQEPKFG